MSFNSLKSVQDFEITCLFYCQVIVNVIMGFLQDFKSFFFYILSDSRDSLYKSLVTASIVITVLAVLILLLIIIVCLYKYVLRFVSNFINHSHPKFQRSFTHIKLQWYAIVYNWSNFGTFIYLNVLFCSTASKGMDAEWYCTVINKVVHNLVELYSLKQWKKKISCRRMLQEMRGYFLMLWSHL